MESSPSSAVWAVIFNSHPWPSNHKAQRPNHYSIWMVCRRYIRNWHGVWRGWKLKWNLKTPIRNKVSCRFFENPKEFSTLLSIGLYRIVTEPNMDDSYASQVFQKLRCLWWNLRNACTYGYCYVTCYVKKVKFISWDPIGVVHAYPLKWWLWIKKKNSVSVLFSSQINWAYNFCILPNPMKIQVMEIIISTCFPSAGGYTLIDIGIKPDL